MFVRCDSPGSGVTAAATLAVVDRAEPALAAAELGPLWHPDAKAATTRVVAARKACLVMPESYRCGLVATRAKRSFCDVPF